VIHLSLISASTCCRRTFSALKKFLSTSALTPRLKKKTLCMSRGPTINCAIAFGTYSKICGTSPPVAVPNTNAT
jgi:hypothetical protein